jgi:uncharacterized membrane protein YkvA (DUF1232 family)
MWALLIRIIGLWVAAKVLSRGELGASFDQKVSRLSVEDKGRLLQRIANDSDLPIHARGVAFLPGLYVMSPIDLVPDFIPLIGKLDDEVVFGVALSILGLVTPRSAIERHLNAMYPERRVLRGRRPK